MLFLYDFYCHLSLELFVNGQLDLAELSFPQILLDVVEILN